MNCVRFLSLCILMHSLHQAISTIKTKTNRNVQSYVSKSKTNWVYQRYPRVGSLFMKAGADRTLYPGTLNCGKNRLTLNEFKQDLTLSFPSAKSSYSYTLVIYENDKNLLVKAIGNIKGEDVYEGRLTGYDVAELSDMEESPTEQIYFAEILEQAADKSVPESKYDRTEWKTIRTDWQNIMNGSASKTCFIIVPEHRQTQSTDDVSDITLLFKLFAASDDAITTT